MLGAGGGWAKSILYHDGLAQQFSDFFQRQDTLTLGVCNGCQMLAQLSDLIPGANHWPRFVRNRSEQFEARTVMVKVAASPSLWLQDLQHCVLPVAVAHGEGRAIYDSAHGAIPWPQGTAMQYVDSEKQPTEAYPMNPNGAPLGLAGVSSEDGRVLIMMPHPERVVRAVSLSWCPESWQHNSPWTKMFQRARVCIA